MSEFHIIATPSLLETGTNFIALFVTKDRNSFIQCRDLICSSLPNIELFFTRTELKIPKVLAKQKYLRVFANITDHIELTKLEEVDDTEIVTSRSSLFNNKAYVNAPVNSDTMDFIQEVDMTVELERINIRGIVQITGMNVMEVLKFISQKQFLTHFIKEDNQIVLPNVLDFVRPTKIYTQYPVYFITFSYSSESGTNETTIVYLGTNQEVTRKVFNSLNSLLADCNCGKLEEHKVYYYCVCNRPSENCIVSGVYFFGSMAFVMACSSQEEQRWEPSLIKKSKEIIGLDDRMSEECFKKFCSNYMIELVTFNVDEDTLNMDNIILRSRKDPLRVINSISESLNGIDNIKLKHSVMHLDEPDPV